ncbi:MAG: helix-turn-helix domain containing protein [Parvibaculaceae bacterium]|nr:helix-turn-helix domain containing protein [Parvibaculaceae bacterium]
METIQSIPGDKPAVRSGGDKRELILDAALELFRAHGFRRTSMEDIAEAAEIAKGTLYLYFRSKEELFTALSQKLGARVLDAMDQAKIATANADLEERLVALFNAKLGFVHHLLNSSPHAIELIDSSRRICEGRLGTLDERFLDDIAELLTEAAGQGQISAKAAGLSLATAGDVITTAVHGAMSKVSDEAEFYKKIREIVHLMVRGLRP